MDLTLYCYTDGACDNRPTKKFGGWANVFCIYEQKKTPKILYENHGYDTDTTSNRMEIMAVLQALSDINENKMLKFTAYVILSDSRYVVDTVSNKFKRLRTWRATNWRNTSGEVKNKDLWVEMFEALKKANKSGKSVSFKWVRGHAGNMLNERADELAVRMRKYADKKYK